MTLCECGCGQEARPGKRFIHGHYFIWLKVNKDKIKDAEFKPKIEVSKSEVINEALERLSEKEQKEAIELIRKAKNKVNKNQTVVSNPKDNLPTSAPNIEAIIMPSGKTPSRVKQVVIPEFNEIFGKLESINIRIDSTNERIDSLRNEINSKFEGIDYRFEKADKKMSSLSEMNVRFDSLEKLIPIIDENTALELKITDIEKRFAMAVIFNILSFVVIAVLAILIIFI